MHFLIKYKSISIAVLFLFVSLCAYAQETLAVGQVMDANDGSAISNVNVYFKNTGIGTKTNDEGFFMIRTQGEETTLVFSCVGYKTKEYKLKKGQSVGIQVEMQELQSELQEVFVFPGVNPALQLMEKVRAARKQNNIRGTESYSAKMVEQQLVLATKNDATKMSRKMFDQLAKSNLDTSSTQLTLPLYMAEKTIDIKDNTKTISARNLFQSKVQSEQLFEQLTMQLTADVNFYQHTVTFFDKEFISPLSNVGNAYYKYYLADSTLQDQSKIYELHFYSLNPKNLAFNGKMWIDSARFSLTKISAEVPVQANINFVKNLRIEQIYICDSLNNRIPESGSVSVNMNYAIARDSIRTFPSLFIKSAYTVRGTIYEPVSTFAATNYQTTDLNKKLESLNETPIIRTARWIADVLLTGYAQVGKIDIGKIQNIARNTEPEGISLSLPFRTNERLWKNLSVGGSAGYGFKNNSFSYSALSMMKLPFGKRNIIGAAYTDQYRGIDYDYNDFIMRESPLLSGDEDISNTIFAFRSSAKVSKRKELSVWVNSDINANIETGLFYRANKIFSAYSLPFTLGGAPIDNIRQQQFTLTARFSYRQAMYNDHLQRIYGATAFPVIYTTLDAGQFTAGNVSGKFAKISAAIKQDIKFGIGTWSYVFKAGMYFGKLPYNLLDIPYGSETRGYSRYQFSCMRYMEYAADKSIQWHNELNFNGILFNNIPLIKHLNLRELVTFKMFYGTLSQSHKQVIDFPVSLHAPSNPYIETGIGVSNILRLFTVQAVWRLTDLHHEGITPWGIRAGINVSF